MPDAPPESAPPRPAAGASPSSLGGEARGASEAAAGGSHDLPYRAELRRKALHLLALVLPLGTALLGKPVALYVLVPGALFALACDVLRSRSPRFARLVRRVFGPLMRADEWKAPSSGRGLFDVRGNGATWALVTMTLLALLFPVPVAVAAFSLFMVGDAAAALVGRRWGQTLWGEGPRTVEGTAAFVGFAAAAVAPLVATGYLVVPWVVAAGAVAVAAAAEALPRPLNDNLRVPLVAACVLFFLG